MRKTRKHVTKTLEQCNLRLHQFLGLFDYVSRAHEMQFVRPSPVRVAIVSNFFQILVVASPGPYARRFLDLRKE